MTSADPVNGPSPEPIASLVLQEVHGGGVTTVDEDYLDCGLPTPGDLAGVFNKLTDSIPSPSSDPGPRGIS